MTDAERFENLGRGFGSPGRYVQRAGELDRLGQHAQPFGQRAFVLVDAFIAKTYGDQIAASLATANIHSVTEIFGGECSAVEIDRVSAAARAAQADCVIGIGGGKALDTAKCAAIHADAAMIICPTIASTDAPCSAIAVRYTSEGLLDTGLFLPRHPNLVLVDSAVIVDAPIRYLVAGMGDALSTWYEARSSREAACTNYIGARYPATQAGLAIARACRDVVLRDGPSAKVEAERKTLTPAVEAIIEANTLLSGLGFENCGVSAAHGISDAMGIFDPGHNFLHGEKVAFGILCLLALEDRPNAEFVEVADFLAAMGLPTRLADFGMDPDDQNQMTQLAEEALKDGASTWRVPLPLTVEAIRSAVIAADARAGDRARARTGTAEPR